MDFYEKLRQIVAGDLGRFDAVNYGDTADVTKAKKHLDQMLYNKKKAKEELTHAYANRWADYKNNSIRKLLGPETASSYTRMGKMFDDAGDIVDIDYDYYSTVPYSALERVFGENAKDVRKVSQDKKKVAEGKLADSDIDYDYYASVPNRIIDIVFGSRADNVRSELSNRGLK